MNTINTTHAKILFISDSYGKLELVIKYISSLHVSMVTPDCQPVQDRHWSEVCEGGQVDREVIKYRDAVWELFQAECKHLTRQLHPLEQVCSIRKDPLSFSSRIQFPIPQHFLVIFGSYTNATWCPFPVVVNCCTQRDQHILCGFSVLVSMSWLFVW